MIEIRKIISTIVFGLMLFSCNASGQEDQNNSKADKVHVDLVVRQLIQADFFKITDSDYLDSAKQSLKDSYVNYDYFGGYTYPDSLRYVDYRFYFVDSEELFEIGGLTEYLDLVKPTFQKLGLKLEYKNEKSVDKESFWKHTIEVNEKEYIAFEGEMSSYDIWDEAYLNFIELLNDQLKLQGSEEQFYPIRSANDGRIVMLTKEQFEIVKKYYPNDNDHPRSIANWINQNK